MNTNTLVSKTLVSLLTRTGQTRTALCRIAFGLMALLTLGLSSPAARAQTYTQQTLHAFGSGTDGQSPHCSLILVNGILYGTTIYGGTSGKGTIFSFDPATNTETILYSFTGPDGLGPFAALLNVNGILYGTTIYGGTKNFGTIFSYNLATSTETTLYSFQGPNNDGSNPEASLINVGGILYSTTAHGGYATDRRFQGDWGTVFGFDPSTNTITSRHLFSGFDTGQGFPSDGSTPVAGLLNVDGILYGTTRYGGNFNDDGTIFAYDPTNSGEHPVHIFKGIDASLGSDGTHPLGGLINVNGLLYGTTYNNSTTTGSGTVFSLDPTTNAVTTLYSFTGDGTNGASAGPSGDLIYDPTSGRLYGTTQQGGSYSQFGASYSAGTVFSIDPVNNSVQIVYSFNDYSSHIDGTTPRAGLIDVNGTLYGTAQSGGVNGKGTIFAIKITAQAPVAHSDSATVKYNTAFAAAAPGVLRNDSNGGSIPLTATLVTSPSHGTLTFNSDGSFTYTPNAGFTGTDSFTYQDTNAVGISNVAPVTITVPATAPVAHNDSATTKYGTSFIAAAPGVLRNDDTGGSPTFATLVTPPAQGTLTFNSDGSFTYTPNTGYFGSDSFTYQAVNSVGTSNIATVALTVTATVPTAHSDSATVQHNTAFVCPAPGILRNDDTGGSAIFASLVTPPTHGTLSLGSDGSFTYTPNSGYSGPDSFTYKDTNAIGTSNTAPVTLTVK